MAFPAGCQSRRVADAPRREEETFGQESVAWSGNHATTRRASLLRKCPFQGFAVPPVVAWSPDHATLSTAGLLFSGFLCGEQWDSQNIPLNPPSKVGGLKTLCGGHSLRVAKAGAERMRREGKRRPSVRMAWRGLETTPQRVAVGLLRGGLHPPPLRGRPLRRGTGAGAWSGNHGTTRWRRPSVGRVAWSGDHATTRGGRGNDRADCRALLAMTSAWKRTARDEVRRGPRFVCLGVPLRER